MVHSRPICIIHSADLSCIYDHYGNLMLQILGVKSVMRHFDLSSIPLFLFIAATSVDGTKNSALLRKIVIRYLKQ